MSPFFSEGFLRKVIISLVLASVEAFLAFLCLVSGIPILLNPTALAPNSILALLPGWTIYLWAIGLVVGGTLSLIGISLSEYRLERIGVLVLIATAAVFSMALLSFLPNALVSFLTYAAFGAAMTARYWVLGKLIRIQNLRTKMLKEEMNGDYQ